MAGAKFTAPLTAIIQEMLLATTSERQGQPCPMGFERGNRPPAANRAEETRGGYVVARWKAVPRKTTVRSARV
jgi:hypothetical protein